MDKAFLESVNRSIQTILPYKDIIDVEGSLLATLFFFGFDFDRFLNFAEWTPTEISVFLLLPLGFAFLTAEDLENSLVQIEYALLVILSPFIALPSFFWEIICIYIPTLEEYENAGLIVNVALALVEVAFLLFLVMLVGSGDPEQLEVFSVITNSTNINLPEYLQPPYSPFVVFFVGLILSIFWVIKDVGVQYLIELFQEGQELESEMFFTLALVNGALIAIIMVIDFFLGVIPPSEQEQYGFASLITLGFWGIPQEWYQFLALAMLVVVKLIPPSIKFVSATFHDFAPIDPEEE